MGNSVRKGKVIVSYRKASLRPITESLPQPIIPKGARVKPIHKDKEIQTCSSVLPGQRREPQSHIVVRFLTHVVIVSSNSTSSTLRLLSIPLPLAIVPPSPSTARNLPETPSPNLLGNTQRQFTSSRRLCFWSHPIADSSPSPQISGSRHLQTRRRARET